MGTPKLLPAAHEACNRAGLLRFVAVATLAWSAAVAAAVDDDLPAAERQVLLDLYRDTDGANWSTNDGWSTPHDEDNYTCQWHGVICDEHWQHVQKLVLDSNNLAGTLPANLGTLRELRGLSLSGNRLTGSVPSLAGLRRLEYLDLSRNQLTGNLPDLSDLVAMESFHVSDNQLSGTLPPLDAMRHLQFFVIANNRFSGPLPPLTALTELKEFSASANAFVGPVPAIAGLPLLHDFFLSDNALDGTMPSLADLPQLRYFRVGNNRLTGALPSLAGVPNLQELDVRGNRLEGLLPEPPPRIAGARLCPNALTHPSAAPGRDARWSKITKTDPWWRDCGGER